MMLFIQAGASDNGNPDVGKRNGSSVVRVLTSAEKKEYGSRKMK